MTKPRIALIVAQASNRVIGKDNQLPWRLPEDLQYFKRVTMGKPIVMGRKTYDSIGRPLPGRTNIVVTRQRGWSAEGVQVADGLSGALALAAQEQPSEIMVIGGAQIYESSLALADRVYLTQVHAEVEGDAWFPELDPQQWREVFRDDRVPTEGPEFSFITLDRVTDG